MNGRRPQVERNFPRQAANTWQDRTDMLTNCTPRISTHYAAIIGHRWLDLVMTLLRSPMIHSRRTAVLYAEEEKGQVSTTEHLIGCPAVPLFINMNTCFEHVHAVWPWKCYLEFVQKSTLKCWKLLGHFYKPEKGRRSLIMLMTFASRSF